MTANFKHASTASTPSIQTENFWAPSHFHRFLVASRFILKCSPSTSLPVPKFELQSDQKLTCRTHLLGSQQQYKLRFYFTRPTFEITRTTPSIPSCQSYLNDPLFKLSLRHQQELTSFLTDTEQLDLQQKKKQLSSFSLIIDTTMSIVNITTWLASKKCILQPVMKEDSLGSFIYVAAQVIDTISLNSSRVRFRLYKNKSL